MTIALISAMVLGACFPLLANASPPEWTAEPMHRIMLPQATSGPTGYTPSMIYSAYGLTGTGGSGTIAIIDAYDDPTVLTDLTAFSTQFNLPQPVLGTNFELVKMSTTLAADAGWALEISLDVQWAHAIAPNAKILLVEANSATLGDLLSAVDYANSRSDVVAISMSWGASEFSTETSYDSHFTSSNGATFYASSGDTGGAIIWPLSPLQMLSQLEAQHLPK